MFKKYFQISFDFILLFVGKVKVFPKKTHKGRTVCVQAQEEREKESYSLVWITYNPRVCSLFSKAADPSGFCSLSAGWHGGFTPVNAIVGDIEMAGVITQVIVMAAD